MHSKWSNKLICGLMIALIPGCAGVSDNPAEGGLFGGIHGISSGAYENRIQNRESNLKQLENENSSYRSMVTELEDSKQNESSRIEKLNKDIQTLDTTIVQLEKNIEHLKITDRKLIEEKKYLNKQLNELKNELTLVNDNNHLSRDETDRQLSELNERRLRLEKELDLLVDYSMTLAD